MKLAIFIEKQYKMQNANYKVEDDLQNQAIYLDKLETNKPVYEFIKIDRIGTN